uniref:Uncharacterized protein AlNc14C64G4577 n=1 Tax=Albugo laibachii Nc14 TaxID=890382 RepID=F0WD57_9STRA|nr:conserved hypothetical protein [Albugo laibachii Nc14]|eukprot:CCA19129.1 conserved hypothetical protein [Albugo laibachii Nc14]
MEQELLHMFQSITTSDHDELVDQFAFLLQTDVSTATFFLESSNWNVETAVNMYLSTAYTSSGTATGTYEQLETQPPQEIQCTPMDIGETITLQGMMITDLSESSQVVFAPGSNVTMNWTFVNSGEVDWPLDTELVCIQGQHFCRQESIPVVAKAKETVHVPVSLCMPLQKETFSSCWRLRSIRHEKYFIDPIWLILTVGDPVDMLD